MKATPSQYLHNTISNMFTFTTKFLAVSALVASALAAPAANATTLEKRVTHTGQVSASTQYAYVVGA